jgi:hypothetical protein
MESIFLVDFIMCFFKEFLGPDISTQGDKPYSTFAEISSNYVNGCFLMDLVPLIPLQALSLKRKRERLFYAVKFLRFFGGLQYYSGSAIVQSVKTR